MATSRPTARVTGGWGEKGSETETCSNSETALKTRRVPAVRVHALLGAAPGFWKDDFASIIKNKRI